MCGFTFILKNKPKNLESSSNFFLEKITDRGNDSSGIFHDLDISLFFKRLSIIDHFHGNQPMYDHSRRYIICFSGEIYNYKEIKNDLISNGSKFQNNSDTEVILEGYKCRGKSFLKDLNGMFSFVIWDFKKKEAFIARDQIGKKALYYMINDDTFCLSTNLATFEYYNKKNKNNINYRSLQNFLISNTEPENNNFFYNGLNRFPNASYAILSKNHINIYPKKYWSLSFKKKNKPLDQLLDEYDFLLNDSVKIRLRSDTKKAISLSGGVDSLSIAMMAIKNLNEDVEFINIDYEKDRTDTVNNDSPDEFVKFINSKIKKIKISEQDFFNYLNKSENVSEIPQNQPQNSLLFKLCEYAGQQSKILLTGNGADEIFFGYNGDNNLMIINKLTSILSKFTGNITSKIIKKYLKNKNDSLLKKISNNYISQDNYINNLEIFDVDNEENKNIELLDLKMFISLFISSQNANYYNPDIIGLKNNVEIRSPFLDYRMIEFAASLPNKYKIGNFFNNKYNKFIVKKNLEKYIPNNLIYKQKRGFGWNMDVNKLFANSSTSPDIFNCLADYNLNKKFFIENRQKFVNQLKKGMHPNPIISRLFFNSIMLCNWIQKQ